MSAICLLEEMDRQQNDVLEQLDQLNERILALIAEWHGDDREKAVKHALAKAAPIKVTAPTA